MSDWISVDDKLPPINESVLIYVDDAYDRGITEATMVKLCDGSFRFDPLHLDMFDISEVGNMPTPTHWMPLPEPPKLEVNCE